MGRQSALARVFELTKSFAPLGFERRDPTAEPDPAANIVADALADAAAEPGEAPAAPGVPSTTETLPLPQAPAAPLSGPGVVLAFPAMTQVTVVVPELVPQAAPALEIAPQEIAPLEPLPVPDASDDVRHAATADAIASIEADIAALLATLDRPDSSGPQADEAVPTDDEEPTLALLSELDRLWQADPQTASR